MFLPNALRSPRLLHFSCAPKRCRRLPPPVPSRPVILENNLPGVRLTSETGFTSEIYNHGAHVGSWRDGNGDAILFLSKHAQFTPPKAIRGGIPICFPQFSNLGPCATQHGFARNQAWELVEQDSSQHKSRECVFQLASSDATKELWPHEFVARFRVALVGDTMETNLSVTNSSDAKTFEFTAALHTYFAVGDIAKASVAGLGNTPYLDSLDGRIEKVDANESVTFPHEVDRIYQQTPDCLQVVDEANNRTIQIKKTNLPDAVVWNPWVDKCKATSDLGDSDYEKFLCVEAAAIQNPVKLAPGETWVCSQVLRVSKGCV